MKSYSDDIPNISTDELKRSALVADETNQLIKANFEEIKIMEHSISERIKTNNILTVISTVLASLSVVGMASMIILLMQSLNL